MILSELLTQKFWVRRLKHQRVDRKVDPVNRIAAHSNAAHCNAARNADGHNWRTFIISLRTSPRDSLMVLAYSDDQTTEPQYAVALRDQQKLLAA